MDEVNYHKAMESFAKAYPHAFKMLEKIKSMRPDHDIAAEFVRQLSKIELKIMP